MNSEREDLTIPARAEAGERLTEALERQVGAYSRLLQLGRSKQEALVDGDIADLRRVVLEEQAVLAQALDYEKAYALACAALASEEPVPAVARAGRDGGQPANGAGRENGDILDLLPPSLRDRANTARGELAEKATQLSLLVRANSNLIRRARSFVDLSLVQIGRASGSPTYDGSGSVTPVTKNMTAASLSRRL